MIFVKTHELHDSKILQLLIHPRNWELKFLKSDRHTINIQVSVDVIKTLPGLHSVEALIARVWRSPEIIETNRESESTESWRRQTRQALEIHSLTNDNRDRNDSAIETEMIQPV